MQTRTVVSEFLGTLLLVFFAVGSAVLAVDYIGTVRRRWLLALRH